MRKGDFIKTILKYIPLPFAQQLMALSEHEIIEEIRFRLNYCCYIYTQDRSYPLSGLRATETDLEEIFLALTQHSPKYYEHQIRSGYLTVEGMRVGVCGEMASGRIFGINIRIPMQHVGVSKELMPYITRNGQMLSTLIVSRPQMGKTTLIRDIARTLGDGINIYAKKVCVIDERGELFGNGIFELGEQTDVVAGTEKQKGIESALRTLSPHVVVTDELGRVEDVQSIRECANSGVAVCATAHGGSINELMRREVFRSILREGVFERYVVLSNTRGRITVSTVSDYKHTVIAQGLLLKELKNYA